ncbi:MAG: VCBS repeat-containing protein [Pseudohongiella sp.]|nr:VCBS repeat-containing protein [Pseudohongiella sp.]MDO9521970.1 VCBS repeat-containing protein [Pseudohongiella sp.]MDP2128605.1 VCBS repeat-containing protein [Pseudohongiella sp.]
MPSPRKISAIGMLSCKVARRRVRHSVVLSLVVFVIAGCQSAPRGQASFQRIELAGRVPASGQLLLADLGGDSAVDILLMSRQPGRLSWFENPGWELHQIPLVADVLHGVAAYSPPGRAGQESATPASLALNGRFSQPGSGTRQQLLWLQHPGRESVDAPWAASLIRSDVQAGALLWADMTGTGRQILVTLPGLEAYTLPLRFSRPWGMMPLAQDPLPPIRVRVYDWDLDGREDLLVVGSNGLDIMALASRGVFVDEFALMLGERGTSGFLDIGVGQSGRAARRFVAALSADGQQLMVFRPNEDERLPWIQEIIADSLVSARVLKVADLNRDAMDEIVLGDAAGVTVFYYSPDQLRWHRYSVDASVAIADIQIQDLNGNGLPDIVTAPAVPGPVTLYQNRGRGN